MFWRIRLRIPPSIRYLIVTLFLSFLVLGGMLREAEVRPVSSTIQNMHAIDTYVTSQMQRLHIPDVALGIVHKKPLVYTHMGLPIRQGGP